MCVSLSLLPSLYLCVCVCVLNSIAYFCAPCPLCQTRLPNARPTATHAFTPPSLLAFLSPPASRHIQIAAGRVRGKGKGKALAIAIDTASSEAVPCHAMPPLLPLPLPHALRNVRCQMAATSPAAALKVSQALRMRESVVYSLYSSPRPTFVLQKERENQKRNRKENGK